MNFVVFISFLLMLSLCSSGLEEGHEIAENNLYSSNKVEELYSYTKMDYPGPHPNPRNDPAPPSPSVAEDMMENYPGPHPNPREDPAPPSPSVAEDIHPNPREDPAPPSPSVAEDMMGNYVN